MHTFVPKINIDNTVYCPDDGATVKLKGKDISTISSPSVNETDFYYFPKIIGGSGDDTFKTDYNFSTGRYFIDTIDGGGGYNTLDISNFPSETEGTFYASTGSGSIPGSIESFMQINQVNLPNDQYLFADIMARTSILSNPDPESHSKSETTGVFMDLQTIPKTTALSNFIIKNTFVDWEIVP